jgi:hypothetical protein
MALKKSVPKKASSKKGIPKKASIKNPTPAKAKTKSKKAIPKEIVPQRVIEGPPTTGDCMCKQKKPNGNFFCFRLIQGRWVQSSAVAFPTRELCEEANC